MSIFQFSIFHNMNINHSSVRNGTEMRKMRSRIFNIMQYTHHPKTGELLLSEDTIKSALEHKGIDKWAYVLHDQDIHTQQECDRYIKDHNGEQPEWKVGDKKPPHWHVVIQFKNQSDTSTVAKWLGITENYVQVPKGNGPGKFLDCVEYLTHENSKQQAAEKHLYSDEEVHSNFDFRSELNQRSENKLKYGGKDLSHKDRIRYDVLYNGKTLHQIIENDRCAYMDDFSTLEKLRMRYISAQKPPTVRINYYIEGKGGAGKGLMSRGLARSLYPQIHNDEDVFFEVGAKGAEFEGYDGQPVIIWNDRRALDLLTELNGRGNVFNVFDTHPTKQKQNIKYGSIYLGNTVNIVNSVQPYKDFLDGLAGEYSDRYGEEHKSEDKGQSYRRFPIIIPIHENDFDILLNRGFMENTDEFEEYLAYRKIRGNMQKIAQKCQQNEELAREIERKTLDPAVRLHQQLISSCNNQTDEEQIRKEFADYGNTEYTTPDILHSDGTEEIRNIDFSKINWTKIDKDNS